MAAEGNENWIQGLNFQFGIDIGDREGEFYRGRWTRSGADVSIWRVSQEESVIAEEFMLSPSKDLLRVYYVGPLINEEGSVVVTEYIKDTFGSWKLNARPKSIVNGKAIEQLSRRRFINPLRSLINSAIAILKKYQRDVDITEETPIYVVDREGGVELKLGFKPFAYPEEEFYLQAFVGIANLVESWLDNHGMANTSLRSLYMNQLLLRSLARRHFWSSPASNRFHLLSYILESPLFLTGREKLRLWDRMSIMERVEHNIHSSTGHRELPFSPYVVTALRDVEVDCPLRRSLIVFDAVMDRTRWYFEEYTWTPFKNWIAHNRFVFDETGTSPQLTLNWIIRSLRNFWAHANESMTDPDDMAHVLAERIEEMVPGIWSIFHYVIMTSRYLGYFIGEVD